MDYLQRLAREWYEYLGYFVRTDLWVGLESDGSYECELDVVAFNPLRHHIVQIEPSLDLLSADEREHHFRIKFDAGRKYLHRLFGAPPHADLEQIALIVSNDAVHRNTIAGGNIVLLSDLIAAMDRTLVPADGPDNMVPEQWPLIRTLQFAARCAGRAPR